METGGEQTGGGTWFAEDYLGGAETWAEARYTQLSAGEKLPLITVVALISLAFGVRNPLELVLGSGGMLAEYFAGGDGLDGAIAVLTGVQLAKRRYATMAFPALLESYKLIQDMKSGTYVNKKSLTRTAIFLTGWMAARYKYV